VHECKQRGYAHGILARESQVSLSLARAVSRPIEAAQQKIEAQEVEQHACSALQRPGSRRNMCHHCLLATRVPLEPQGRAIAHRART
jgi:hypothetical protein